MNVLLVCKLSDQTLRENVLLPLLCCKLVDRVYLLRDIPIPLQNERILFVGSKRQYKGGIRHFVKTIRGVRIVHEYKIDAIIGVLNTPHGFIGRTISLLTRIPYIHMTIAGHREFWRGGKLFETLNIKYLLHGSAITVTGEQTRKYLTDRNIPSQNIFVLPNLPNECFNHVGKALNREYDIISFSRIDRNKNVSLLLKAIARLSSYPSIRVAIMGDGDMLDQLKQLAKELNLTDRVFFGGYVRGVDSKIKVLSNSKIFVSCSKGEGFPVSLLEAMECGCVPVVSNVGDIPDVIHQGENGFMFNDTDDESELVSLLDDLLANKEMMLRISNEAQRIKEKISVSANGVIWEHVLSFAINK